MATIYPEKPEFDHSSEEVVYDFIRDNLPFDYICYFNYHAGLYLFDIGLLVPGRGIVVLEIKSWSGDNIEVKDNNTIIYYSPNGRAIVETSPLKQARRYRFELIDKIKKELDINVPVLEMVCYPNMSKEKFSQNRLDIVSPEQQTVLWDDFQEPHGLQVKIDELFNCFHYVHCDEFNEENMLKIRSLNETVEQIDSWVKQYNIQSSKPKRRHYSILVSLPGPLNDSASTDADRLINQWTQGTKILLATNSSDIVTLFKSKLQSSIEELQLQHVMDVDNTFNFFIYQTSEHLESFEIIDGSPKQIEQYCAQLQLLSQSSAFNLNQYQIEHAPTDRHILIKAGAGTGKTFSMISRISFLIYAHGLNYETLKEAIYLITFTNEAAKNMKKRLQEYLRNYYLLTKDYDYFKMIETIEELNISTIHSLSKKILQRFSSKLGLGKDFRIVSGKYDRDQVLARVLDQTLEQSHSKNPEIFNHLKMSMYHLQERLKLLAQKLESKNMDVLNDQLDFGTAPITEYNDLVIEVLQRTEELMRQRLSDNNVIRLGDLIIKLKQLLTFDLEWQGSKVKYLFVDEFQDTDDVQINLMKEFQKKLGFHFFVVGDVKQCIYRFRGAEDKAFDVLTGKQPDWGLKFTLNKNYRSDKLLLEKYEQIFEKWGQDNLPMLTYQKDQDSLTSHIEINTPGEDFFREITIADGTDIEKQFIEQLKICKDAMPDGETLAILVRENKEAQLIKEWGMAHNCYIEIDTGGKLYQSEPIIDLYKLVLALQNSTSPRHLFNLYDTAYMAQPLPRYELYQRRNNTWFLVEFFNQHNPLQGTGYDWQNVMNDLKHEPILYVLRKVIIHAKPWEKYATKQTDNDQYRRKMEQFYKANLDQVFEKMINLANTDYLTINKIEQFLRIMILTKQAEESRDDIWVNQDDSGKKVVCLTVHKAKGLEFHTVLLPFGNNDLTSQRKLGPVDVIVTGQKVGYSMLLDEKLEGYGRRMENNHYRREKKQEVAQRVNEETRILYVAMTRAIKNFVYFYNENSNPKKSWQNFIKEGLQ